MSWKRERRANKLTDAVLLPPPPGLLLLQYIDEIGILTPFHNITIVARSFLGAHPKDVQGRVAVDGLLLPDAETHMGWREEKLKVVRTNHEVRLTIPGLLDMSVDIARAFYWAGEGPGRNFLNLRIHSATVTPAVHGVLGQTYRDTPAQRQRAATSRKKRLKSREGILVEGREEQYRATGLLHPDCSFAKFKVRELGMVVGGDGGGWSVNV